jgi:putative hemolysin
VLKPVVWFLSVSTNGVLRLLRINPNESTEAVSEEDIMGLVDAVEEQGEIDNDTKEMIENVFEFDNTAVSEIMVRRSEMTVIYESDSHEEILRTLQESGLSRFPVCGENTDDVKGILRAREYLFALHENPACKLSDVIREAKFVPDTIPANILFKEMRENKIHMAIVVDEYGQTAGLVTMEDLLESIVGNIYDETDVLDAPEIEMIEEDRWQVAGSMSVEDAAEEIGVALREGEDSFDTVGGFVIANLAYIPQDGETPEFTYKNLQVKVLTVKEKRIEKIEILKTQQGEDGETATDADVDASSK